jgi:hypothetical protein
MKRLLKSLIIVASCVATAHAFNYYLIRKMLTAHFPHLEPNRLVRAYIVLQKKARANEFGDINTIDDELMDALLIKEYYQLPF